MILVDSLYINRSGSKVLLEYLISNLEARSLDCFYLFDERNENKFPEIPSSRKAILKPNMFDRLKFYFNNQHKFSKVLCFAGVPAPVNINGEVICYFHNMSILPSRQQSAFDIIRITKFFYLKYFLKNVSYWVVQTEYVKEALIKKLKIPANSIHIYPFFIDNKPIDKKVNATGQNFLFVSEFFLHKNHTRLFEAFIALSKDYPEAKLFITLDESNVRSNQIVDSYRKKCKNIINLGFHPKVDIQKLYGLADCVVFPSLEESFGLGLIEAAQLGLPVLASDLPFVHKVIQPTEVFNPLDIKSIEQSMRNFLKGNATQQTTLLIKDQLDEIIKIISDKAVLQANKN